MVKLASLTCAPEWRDKARAAFAVSLVILSGCHKADSAAIARQGPNAYQGTVGSFPSYAAEDYDKPGRPGPSLSPSDTANIENVLSQVKPCQRPLVRYSFGNGSTSAILFFEVPPGSAAHVLGTANEYYDPGSGSVIPASDNPAQTQMEKEGLKWGIDLEPCPTGKG